MEASYDPEATRCMCESLRGIRDLPSMPQYREPGQQVLEHILAAPIQPEPAGVAG